VADHNSEKVSQRVSRSQKQIRFRNCVAMLLGISLVIGCSTASIESLGVGDCFNGPEVGGDFVEIGEVDKIDCDEPHRYEMYAVTELEGSSFPGDAQAASIGDDFCLSRFASFVGIEYEYSIYYGNSIVPSIDSWSRGDHSIQCVVGLEYGSKVGSARNARE